MLACSIVSKRFGGTLALDGVSLKMDAGETVGLIGPNGSGKSTLVNLITGFYKPDSGEISLDGRPITGIASHKLRRLGMSRTFQNTRLYEELSPLENVLVGIHTLFLTRSGSPWAWAPAMLNTKRGREREGRARSQAWSALREMGLEGAAHRRTKDLPFGMKKRLELARALVGEPKLLLLDEPTAGLSPEEAHEIVRYFRGSSSRSALAILLIEHRLDWVLEVSDRIVVLDSGKKIAEGSPAQITKDASVIKAYIGE